ncbi:hypothetical protein L210DRAFT_3391113, partial [Boletus edulis BED1]
MAAPRIARLTLFSGPQCSLCEIAKAELAKVKKQREFDLEVINIQDNGREKWKKNQGSLGCLHSARGVEATGSDTRLPTIDGMTDAPGDSFIVDTTSSIYPFAQFLGQWQSCLYDRIPGITLGEDEGELLASTKQNLRLCFNCGSPDHAVASCPEPINQYLVTLSRQLFSFLHPGHNGRETPRFYAAEGWRQQRLEWLRSYEPG